MQDAYDPSMEHALAAIKRVMAEEKELRVASRIAEPTPQPTDDGEQTAVLELDESMVEELNLPTADLEPPLVSSDAAAASRPRLAELQQAAAAAPAEAAEHPLEQMVRDMLRPALKDWLDRHLPAMVEEHVKREIGRITGKRF